MCVCRVSSKFLTEGSLNSCVSLTKLNLSRTRVSNKGKISTAIGVCVWGVGGVDSYPGDSKLFNKSILLCFHL